MSVDLAIVIAPNGLGHFRRVVRQLDGLVASRPRLKLGVVCESWQLESTRDWEPLRRLLATQPEIATGVFEFGFRWVNDSAAFDERRLRAWLEKLASVAWLSSARRVLSDNLVGILELRSDAVLGGSFLWSDVLEKFAADNPAVERFVEWERRLLRAHRPSMLCVGGLAMPGVLQQTSPVALPWLCEWATTREPSGAPSGRIGVLGGATGTAVSTMVRVVRALLEDPHLEVRVEQSLKTETFRDSPAVTTFSHDEAGYQALSLAFIRPGAGTITDCVGSQVPMILLDEPENLEMAHNARAIERLRLGERMASSDSAAALGIAYRNLEKDRWLLRMAAFGRLERDGLRGAVEWLANWVGA